MTNVGSYEAWTGQQDHSFCPSLLPAPLQGAGAAQRAECLLLFLLQPQRARGLPQGDSWTARNECWIPRESDSFLVWCFWLSSFQVLVSYSCGASQRTSDNNRRKHVVLCCQQAKNYCHLLTAFPGYAGQTLTQPFSSGLYYSWEFSIQFPLLIPRLLSPHASTSQHVNICRFYIPTLDLIGQISSLSGVTQRKIPLGIFVRSQHLIAEAA